MGPKYMMHAIAPHRWLSRYLDANIILYANNKIVIYLFSGFNIRCILLWFIVHIFILQLYYNIRCIRLRSFDNLTHISMIYCGKHSMNSVPVDFFHFHFTPSSTHPLKHHTHRPPRHPRVRLCARSTTEAAHT